MDVYADCAGVNTNAITPTHPGVVRCAALKARGLLDGATPRRPGSGGARAASTGRAARRRRPAASLARQPASLAHPRAGLRQRLCARVDHGPSLPHELRLHRRRWDGRALGRGEPREGLRHVRRPARCGARAVRAAARSSSTMPITRQRTSCFARPEPRRRALLALARDGAASADLGAPRRPPRSGGGRGGHRRCARGGRPARQAGADPARPQGRADRARTTAPAPISA